MDEYFDMFETLLWYFCCHHGNHFRTTAAYLKTKKALVLKSCYYWEKYLSKSKQHGLPDALSNNLSFGSLSVMIYEQFMVSIAELIMLS